MRMLQRLAALKARHDGRARWFSLSAIDGWHTALYWRFEALAWLKGEWR